MLFFGSYMLHIYVVNVHIYAHLMSICATIYVVIRAYTWDAEHIYVHMRAYM